MFTEFEKYCLLKFPEQICLDYNSPQDVDLVRTMLQTTMLTLKSFNGVPLEERVSLVFKSLDVLLKDLSRDPDYQKVRCKRKCSNCCHICVAVTEDEAKILATKRDLIDRQALKEQALYTPETWINLELKYRKCVFLRDDECSIYESRPVACRVHFVASDPSQCDLSTRGMVEAWRPILLTIFTSALDIVGKSGYMAVQLEKIL